ncbi:hypothetical protein HNQ94_001220 [Salirhabdus euzebyi]|uniref:Uncharacterized protein n=1 Tax=Salirhabdus euzebyi TaxID=394506 RepID=A0A841PXJ8_9BACI|nr:hypothetical protein [Salirhabdus euzebyi]MBB6452774.1 hypothetical protein [Salirhabdus euzebyi]
MPYEKAGRADKQGNRYEIKWCVYQLLKVLEEKLDYITLEAIGEDEEGVDLWVGYKNGTQEGQQCKGRNGANETWSYGALNSKEILSKWKSQLDREEFNYVSLVSPIGFTYLEDLIHRAKTSSDNPKLFYEQQIKGSDTKFISFVRNFCKGLGFDFEDKNQLRKMINYLCRICYRQSPDGERKEIILDKIGLLFQGDEVKVYNALVTWIIDGDILGKRIGITQIHSFLDSQNIRLRNLDSDTRIYPKIQELNNEYKTSFRPLDNGIISRIETDACISQILEGSSVIVHGMAGSGKSGLTENVIKFCEKEEVPYLAIKLDKRVPRQSVKQWSELIGLPSSLVHCLNSISKNTNAVIILDQLDGLRWTLPHSREALLVCSELIRQVKHVNLEREKKISIIFSCRTYDYENDNNIKVLFNENKGKGDIWKKVEVNELADETVKGIVGSTYNNLTNKLKKLLRLPSNLYIWQQLNRPEIYNEFTSTYHLVTEWWKQLVRESIIFGLNESDLEQTKGRLVEAFEESGKHSVLSTELSINSSSIDFLVSNGFIVKQDIGSISIVSFVHQSLYDCFLAEKMLISYLKGNGVIEIIGSKKIQTPTRRYQMQMFMQSVYEYSEDEFLSIGKQILNASSIRFSFKFVFLELLNQITEPSERIKNVVLQLIGDEKFGPHIINNVIPGNKEYVESLRENGLLEEWLASDKKSVVISLFQSIRGKHSKADLEFIEKHIFDSEDDISRWLRCFSFDVLEDSDDEFELRMKVYKKYPEQMEAYFDMKSLFKGFEMRALDIITLMYETTSKNGNRLFRYEEEFLESDTEFLVQNGLQVLDKLLPLVPIGSDYALEYSDWSIRSEYKKSIERTIIEIIKKANVSLIKKDPESFWNLYKRFMGKGYTLFTELILDGLKYLPLSYCNQVILYLIKDIESNMFVKGSNDELHHAIEVINKHFKECDSIIKNKFLLEVIMFSPSDMVDRYKQRIQFNRERNGLIVYWPFWGDFQHEILGTIPDEQLNEEAFSLKRVLARKFEEVRSRYKNHSGHGGWVRSPVDGKVLSDTSWLKILTSKKLAKRSDRRPWKEVKGGFIESSINQFSSSLSNVAAKEPKRMILLVLSINEIIHDTFVDALYNGISMSEHLNTVPANLIERLLERYPPNNESSRASSICHIVTEHIEKQWSVYVLEIIKDIAINHLNPEIGKPVVTTENDNEMRSVDMLRSNASNCVRGNASRAIGSLLMKDDALYEEFKDIILALTEDENPAVQYASLYALWPSYNIDKEWTMENIIKLYRRDIRNTVFHNYNSMFFMLYDKYKEGVLDIIKKCFESEDDELIKVGSYVATEMYIQKGEFKEIFDDISKITEDQAQSIMFMTIQYFEIEKYVDQAKELILKFNKSHYDLERAITRLLYDNLIDMKRDRDFLHQVLKSKFSRKIAYTFNKFIEKSAESIIYFSDLIFELSYSVIESSDNHMDPWGAEDEISKLIIGLYDEICGLSEAKMNEIEEECLDLWDLMFEKQIGSVRKLSFEMMQR